jgi:hypothetical protein
MKTSTALAIAWGFGAFQVFALRAIYPPDAPNQGLTLWLGIVSAGVAVAAGLVSICTRK